VSPSAEIIDEVGAWEMRKLRTTRLLKLAVALVVGGSLVVAGCGGGGTKTTSSAESVTTTTAGGTGDLSARCAAALSAMAKATATAVTGVDVSGAVKEMQAMASAAPKAIQDDLSLLVAAYTDVAKALKDAGYDPAKPPTSPADMAKYAGVLSSVGQKLSDAKYEAASKRVQAWFDAGCKS
jgi:hypothetical protein